MNRRSFLKWFGAAASIAIYPLDKAFELALRPSKEFTARLGEWNNYYSEGDPELMEAIENWKSYPVHPTTTLPYDKELVANLKVQSTVFDAIVSKRAIPVNTGVKREFFRYEA